MISLLLSSALGLADPGRTLAGLTVGLAPEGSSTSAEAPPVSLRGHVDYGLVRHLTLRAELGGLPGRGQLTVSAGPQLDLIDSHWWRVGLAAQPELVLAASETPGRAGGLPLDLDVRAGLRVDWLLFWGLCLSSRLDTILQPAPGGPWERSWDAGLGLSVRL